MDGVWVQTRSSRVGFGASQNFRISQKWPFWAFSHRTGQKNASNIPKMKDRTGRMQGNGTKKSCKVQVHYIVPIYTFGVGVLQPTQFPGHFSDPPWVKKWPFSPMIPGKSLLHKKNTSTRGAPSGLVPGVKYQKKYFQPKVSYYTPKLLIWPDFQFLDLYLPFWWHLGRPISHFPL